MLDAGNALFLGAGQVGKLEKDRAAFIMATMGKLGTRAMGVGHRDLSAGTEWLAKEAKKAGVTLLSANLRVDGKPVFPGSTVVEVNGVKVGLVGITMPGPVPGQPNAVALPSLAAAKEELAKLPAGLDLRVIIAPTPYADALQLAAELKSGLDLVLETGDGRVPSLQKVNQNYLASPGERGRQLHKLTLGLEGKGAFVDLDDIARSKELLDRAEANLKVITARRDAAQGEWEKAQTNQTIAELTARRDELKKAVDQGAAKGARTIQAEAVNLDTTLTDDPELKKKILQYEPTGSAPH